MHEYLIANGFRVTMEGQGLTVYRKQITQSGHVTFFVDQNSFVLHSGEKLWERKTAKAARNQLYNYGLVEER